MITDISQLDLDKKYSYADYLTWKFDEMVELIKGRISLMSPAPNRNHQAILGDLHWSLRKFFIKKPCEIYLSPFDVMLLNKKKSTINDEIFTVIQPDLCIVCDESKLDEQGCKGSPDLVIEILSPGNSKKEMGLKFDLYEENEIPEYWIVEPYHQSIQIFTLQNKKYIGLRPFTTDDIIKSPLFPNLTFNVKDIFNI